MAMVDASLLVEIVVALSIALGTLFAVAELRDMKKDRRMQLILQANAHMSTREFMDAFCKIWRSNATDAKEIEKQVSFVDLNMVANYFEAIAHLATQSLVHKRILMAYFPYFLIWKKISPWVLAERIALDLPPLYRDIETLAHWQEKERDFGMPQKNR
jgi:hypothetical protein